MPSVTKRSLRNSRADRKDKLRKELLVGVEQLLETGERYTDLHIDHICTASGVARSTFYVYFTDKTMLLQEFFEDLVKEQFEKAQPWWELPQTASRDELREAFRSIFETSRDHRFVWAAAVEAAAYDDGMREQFASLMKTCVEAVAAHIRGAQERGFARRDRDPETMASWLLWMTERGLYQLVADADGDRLEALLESFTNIYWDSLYAQPR